MATHLLTWNPRRSGDSAIEAIAVELLSGRHKGSSWSSGSSRNISPGSRFFLLRQGVEPRGVVGSGWITGEPFSDLHWDRARAARGDEAHYVPIRFDHLIPPDVAAPFPGHRVTRLKKIHWATQSSGIRIPDDAAELLEQYWRIHLGTAESPEPSSSGMLEGRTLLSWRKHYSRERELREDKIQDAIRRSADGRLRCEVPGCGFDFEETYGILGKRYAHVHHEVPLSSYSKPRKTKLSELRIVCANCHAMIHLGGETRPLKSLIKNARRGK